MPSLLTNNLPCALKDVAPFDKIWSLIKRNTATSSFTYTGVGAATWNDLSIGAATRSYVPSTSSEAAFYKMASPAAATNAVIWADTARRIELNSFKLLQLKLNLFNSANVRMWIGLVDVTDGGVSGSLQSSNPNQNLVCMRYTTAADSNFKGYASTDSSHFTLVDPASEVPDNSGASHVYTFAQQTTGRIDMFVDGRVLCGVSSNLPGATTLLSPFVYLETLANSSVAMGFQWVYWEER